MPIRVQWTDNNSNEDGHEIYVRGTEMTWDSDLPTPTLVGANVTTAELSYDETQPWYVIVASIKGGYRAPSNQFYYDPGAPLTVFSAESDQLFWADITDTSMMFQDTSMTTPVLADGDPVRVIVDKFPSGKSGAEELTNPTFDGDTTGWSDLSGGISINESDNLRVENSGQAYEKAIQALTLETGKEYTFSATLVSASNAAGESNWGVLRLSTSSNGAGSGEVASALWSDGETGTKSFTFTAAQSTYYLALTVESAQQSASYYTEWSEASVKLSPRKFYTSNGQPLVYRENAGTPYLEGAAGRWMTSNVELTSEFSMWVATRVDGSPRMLLGTTATGHWSFHRGGDGLTFRTTPPQVNSIAPLALSTDAVASAFGTFPTARVGVDGTLGTEQTHSISWAGEGPMQLGYDHDGLYEDFEGRIYGFIIAAREPAEQERLDVDAYSNSLIPS